MDLFWNGLFFFNYRERRDVLYIWNGYNNDKNTFYGEYNDKSNDNDDNDDSSEKY